MLLLVMEEVTHGERQHNQGVGILARETEKDDQTQIHLTDYSLEGLRTLVVAVRDLTDAELEQWQCQYEDASTSLIDRAAKLRQTAALVECNLNLLGATVIEDKLQDDMQQIIMIGNSKEECRKLLTDANIRHRVQPANRKNGNSPRKWLS
ncbi:hypothetical protein GQ457_13G027230 [Hibiscus cannabinus]